ncbi:MAG: hypothetical protein KGL43_22760 [Burkholderiales bacterium]|nr:hypothetical protein [Burkholderiales bacterium]
MVSRSAAPARILKHWQRLAKPQKRIAIAMRGANMADNFEMPRLRRAKINSATSSARWL